MADLFSIGVSGLRASQSALTVTGHNISNVNTQGFSRQSTVQVTNHPQFSGAGYIGTGTTLTDVRRSYSEFLSTQLRSSTSLSSDVEAYKSQISQLDSMLSATTTSVNGALQSFFSSMQTAAEDPANIPARQLVLSQAEGVAKRFNTLYDRLMEQNNFANSQMKTVTDQINQIATSIGSLNEAITRAGSNGPVPNDLLDARDEALRQLSSYVGNSTVVQDGNSVSVFIGSGQPLIVGGNVNRLEISNSTGDPTRNSIQFVTGGTSQDVTSLITGGELGGLIRYREEVLDPTLNSLGRLAMTFSEQVNSQLGQGLDLKGNVGSALFDGLNSSKQMELRVNAFSDNRSQASGSMAITNTSVLAASDYRLEFDGSGYTARRLSDGASITVTDNNGTLSFTDAQGRDQGFTMTMDSTPLNGDKFLLMPTRRGATEIAQVLDQPDQLGFAAPLRSESDLQNSGNGVIGQPSVDLVIDPGSLPQQSLISDALSLDHLKALGSLEMRYNATSGELEFVTPLPAGVSITTAPQASPAPPAPPAAGPTPITGLPITLGQSNQLSYAIEVNVGGVTQSYSVSQTISGRPNDGDSFSVSFNQSGVSDNRNALKLVDLQNKQVVGVDPSVTSIATGTSFSDSYGDLIERVGTLTAQANQDSDATTAILKQATDNRDSLSGVNLDEEAANLIKFEQYYNASAQLIQVARSLFDTLLSSVR